MKATNRSCLSSRGTPADRGDPPGLVRGLPQSASLLRKDKPEFMAGVVKAREVHAIAGVTALDHHLLRFAAPFLPAAGFRAPRSGMGNNAPPRAFISRSHRLRISFNA